VKVDPSQIDQIMANLCVNARDAIADVGIITIASGNDTVAPSDGGSHAGLMSGTYVRLDVTDTGSGMDADTLEHLFEPFFTTKGVGKGTGLGLATVYGIVKQNDGFIQVKSELGTGTTFTVFLPRHVGQASQTATDTSSSPVARGRETILLVEDEPAILNMTTRLLERHGYDVLATGSPDEAIRISREYLGDIQLLITDVVMPGMNGRDLAEHILSLRPNLARLFMSGYPADAIAHRNVLAEGVHFIQKPFTSKNLTAKVREALDLPTPEPRPTSPPGRLLE
jgi:CheY-like chemotaxis protein